MGDVAVTFKKFPKPIDDRPTVEELKYTEWRGDTAQKLRELDCVKWVKEHIATDTIREDEGILSEYANVLSLFIEKELLEALE